MPDDTFDAVIIGGGTKGLLIAMYLIKYGGMSVGIFERRHEIGGCLATEEISAPGFRGNTHANIIIPFYYAPHWRDFPEFWDYGAQVDQYLCSDGAVFANNETCLAIYSEKHDPTQERTAKEIARFSERDAEKWLKLWEITRSDEMQRVSVDGTFNPPEAKLSSPEFGQRQMAVYQKLAEAGLAPDGLTMAASPLRAAKEFWESEEVQHCALRFAVSAVMDINETGQGAMANMIAGHLPTLGFARGGTHQIAHAAHQVLVQLGCKFFTHSEVEKAIIENGTATGIRLTDGSEIKARKIVVSAGMSPAQLCFDIIGRDYLDEKMARRVDLLETTFGCLMWYSYALHEAPRYKAEAFNPDIHETFWLALAESASPQHIANECRYAKLGIWPPLEDFCSTIWCHSLVDPAYAPPGKHVAQNEQLGPAVTWHTEKEWLEIKKWFAEQLMKVWVKHAPNMTYDNVIGIDTNSPYDNLRMKNLGPNGTMAGIDRPPHQSGDNRPTPELANYRTPIKNLYGTGGCWHGGSHAGSSEAYNCYKIIAAEHGLGKPWEEQGKEEPDSLVQQTRNTVKRMQESFKRS